MFRALSPTRLLMAMTLAVMAMLATSAGVQAHTGHDHGARPAAASVTYAPAQAGEAVAAVSSVRQSMVQAAPSKASATKGSAQRKFDICLRGCCLPGGAGCLTAWVGSDPGLPTPILLPIAVNLTVVGGDGVKPDALPEPPNSLA
jgi:hypothetical protein